MMNKTIPVFDEAGNYIKDVFPRYAIQRVLKGQAIWIKRSSAIQVLKPFPQYWSLFFCPRCHEQTNCALPK